MSSSPASSPPAAQPSRGSAAKAMPPNVGGSDIQVHPEVLDYRNSDTMKVLLALRWVNSLCILTFFQPDEFFQALEPAWNIAFGPSSGAWLTWEWQHQLRSSLHPALFAGAYVVADNAMRLVHCVGPLRAIVLAALPGAVQGVFAALADFYTWKLAEKVFGQGSNASYAALWLSILNPWQWFCSTRTFSNSLETTLTVMALYHWPWELLGDAREGQSGKVLQGRSSQGLRLSLLLAAAAVVLRPTNLLIWLAVLTLTVTRMTLDGKSPLDGAALATLLGEAALCGSAVLAASAASDRFYFGFWTFPAYKWLHFNISQDLAVFYGHNDWHYYLSQGVPLLTTTALPFALAGLCGSLLSSSASSAASVLRANTLKTLSFAVVTTVAALSLVSHKEVRFIYPLLPILHVLAAPHVVSFFTTAAPEGEGEADKKKPSTSSSSAAATKTTTEPSPTLRRKPILYSLLALNLLLAGYLSLFHQAAPISVVTFLRHEYERLHGAHLEDETLTCPAPAAPSAHPSALTQTAGETGACGDELFALFLAPCHSTPWRSRLVYPGLRARALTCEPPLDTPPRSAERAAYLDEADRFYATYTETDGTRTWGVRFLSEEMWPLLEAGYPRGGEVPRYIVGFEGVEGVLRAFFDGPGSDMGVRLRRVWARSNGLFHEDWRRRGELVVWDTGVYANTSAERTW